jgi:hypothetical protein
MMGFLFIATFVSTTTLCCVQVLASGPQIREQSAKTFSGSQHNEWTHVKINLSLPSTAHVSVCVWGGGGAGCGGIERACVACVGVCACAGVDGCLCIGVL